MQQKEISEVTYTFRTILCFNKYKFKCNNIYIHSQKKYRISITYQINITPPKIKKRI